MEDLEEDAKKEKMYKCIQSQLTDNQNINGDQKEDYTVIMKAFLALVLQKEREIIQLQKLLKAKEKEIEEIKRQQNWEETHITPLKLQTRRNIVACDAGMSRDRSWTLKKTNEAPINDTVKLKGNASIDEQIRYFDGKFFNREANNGFDDAISECLNFDEYENAENDRECETHRVLGLETKPCHRKVNRRHKFARTANEYRNRFLTGEVEASVIMLRKEQKHFGDANEVGGIMKITKINLDKSGSEQRLSRENSIKLEEFEELVPSFQEKRVSIERQLKDIHLASRSSRAKSLAKEKEKTKKAAERTAAGHHSSLGQKKDKRKVNLIEDKIILKKYGTPRDI